MKRMSTSVIEISEADVDIRNGHFQKKKKVQNGTGLFEKNRKCIKTSILCSSMDMIYCTK